MARRSLRRILPIFAALGVACENGFEPDSRVLTRLEVRPNDATLFVVAPWDTLQLYLGAYDQTGLTMPLPRAATYSFFSSAPAIASVSNDGLVTAAAPGTALITAALTLGGITRTTFIYVTVSVSDDSSISGAYDLTARVPDITGGGFDYIDYRFKAVLTLWRDSLGPVEGTFTDLQLIGQGVLYVSDVAETGLVTSSLNSQGQLILSLLAPLRRLKMPLTVAVAAPGFFAGTFACCNASGTVSAGMFSATRRKSE